MTVVNTQRRPAARPHLETTLGPDGTLGWRLVAANGRTLGVSTDRWDTSELVQSAFQALAELSGTTGSFGHPSGGLGWTWRLLNGAGIPLAAGPRTFERRASCARSFEHFKQTLQTFAPLAS